jgi:hypothetical protein
MTPSGQIESSSASRNKPSSKMIVAGVLVVLIVLFAIADADDHRDRRVRLDRLRRRLDVRPTPRLARRRASVLRS